IFQPQELQVQALVMDKTGGLYAATNPDGKVYKLEHTLAISTASQANGGDTRRAPFKGEWKSSVFFDPQTKYIWGLDIDDSGNLYVATGDHGEIFRVTPDGQHSVFFKSDEPHIRVLAFDAQGNLIAGSDGSGLIYRITPKGEGFVLYSAPKREITSLALDDSGNLYFSAAGEKRGGTTAPSAPLTIPVTNPTPPPAGATPNNPAPEPAVQVNTSSAGVSGGSEVYRIAPDGSPSRLWTSRDDLVYSLAFTKDKRLLA